MNNEELWQTVLSKVQFSVSRANFATWFRNTKISSKEEGVATILVENSFSREWLSNKYSSLILKNLRELDSEIKNIDFLVSPDIKKPIPQKTEKEPPKGQLPFQEFVVNQKTNLNPKYTFDNFIVGRFNELAHAASWSITESPGGSYNPLFIYGGVGLGKTHLLQATGNRISELFPNKKIKYIPCERFVTGVVDAIKNRTINDFKEKLKQIDVLIMDDVQFFAGKDKSQEEFYHIFNLFYHNQKQIILTSDRSPNAIPAIEERLRSRFEGGMITDVGTPDIETKMAILKEKCDEKEVNLDPTVLEFIASNIKTNIRELEGALNRVIFLKKVHGKSLDIEDVKKTLNNVINPPKKATNAKTIMDSIVAFYNLGEQDLIMPTRRQEIVRPRQIAMYLLREELGESYPSIGRKFGGKDHTTAIYACSKIGKELQENEDLVSEINLIKQKLYSGTIRKN